MNISRKLPRCAGTFGAEALPDKTFQNLGKSLPDCKSLKPSSSFFLLPSSFFLLPSFFCYIGNFNQAITNDSE
jgi:hypothetical protein